MEEIALFLGCGLKLSLTVMNGCNGHDLLFLRVFYILVGVSFKLDFIVGLVSVLSYCFGECA